MRSSESLVLFPNRCLSPSANPTKTRLFSASQPPFSWATEIPQSIGSSVQQRFSQAFFIRALLHVFGLGLAFGWPVFTVPTVLAATNEIQYLSGTDKDHTIPWQFRVSAGRNAGVWTNIPVPSCWDTKGFGSYEYGNDTTSEYGEYRHWFTVPEAWTNKRVFLVYEGSMTDTETRVNGLPPGGAVVTSGLVHDRAFDNSGTASAGQMGGLAMTAAGQGLNLGTLTNFTLTGWIKPDGSFNALPNARFPRLISLGAASEYDGGTANGLQLVLYNSSPLTRALQLKIHSEPGSGAISRPDILSGSDWTFVAVSYDFSGQVKFYVADKTGPLTNAVSVTTYPRHLIHLGTNAYLHLLNRSDRSRAFDGWGDDFRIFNTALDAAQLEAVRASGLGLASEPPAPVYHWTFDSKTSAAQVQPVAGKQGVLTLQNAGGVPSDMHTPAGEGLSSGVIGTTAAFHQGSFYEFSFEVTTNLVFGSSNLLEVTVRKKSSNTSVNQAERQADYWTFGGIYRPAYLEARPRTFIERIATDARADGTIAVHGFFSGINSPSTFSARILDTNGLPLSAEFSTTVAAHETNAVLTHALPAPNVWSPEFPNLYQLTVELRQGPAIVHSRTETIGFRTVTFTNGVGFFLNGRKVMMRGANRHEFWPTDGRTTSRALSISDIELMKDMNLNAVRMSHYPPARHFLEECDRRGLLVINELAGWQSPAYDNSIAPRLVRELVIRDVNHPCIFAWANGNEGGFNTSVDGDYALWDPQDRKVLHPANWESETTGGVRTHHYALYSAVTNYLGAGKPVFMPTEIQHALYDGGGGAGLEDHWQVMRASPNSAGMFIWSLFDEGVVRDDQNGAIDTDSDSAPDGILGPFREKEASYYTVKAVWSPIQITPPSDGAFTAPLAIENRFSFTSLRQCTFRWQLGSFPDPNASADIQNAGFLPEQDSGGFAGPHIPAGASGTLTLALPAHWQQFDAVRLIAKDPHGREVYTWTWPIRSPAQIRDRIVQSTPANPPAIVVSKKNGALTVATGARVFRLDPNTGRLMGVLVSNQPLSLANGPRLVNGSWTNMHVNHGFEGSDYVLTATALTDSGDNFQWRIRTNGWLTLNYRYTVTGTQTWLGVTFDYPENKVTAMRWLGQGPYRVWKNRLSGQELAVHYKTANDTDTGKSWNYPEFRGYHGRLHWACLDTLEGKITVTAATPDLFLRVLTPPLPSRSRPGVSPPFPAGNLSLLHGINAIGNKFALPEVGTTGPSSASNLATGLYTGEVDFYFGELPPAKGR